MDHFFGHMGVSMVRPEMEDNGPGPDLSGRFKGLKRRLGGGAAIGGADGSELKAIGRRSDHLNRNGAEIMKGDDLNNALFYALENTGPKGVPEIVSEFDGLESHLPDFLKHRSPIAMTRGIPAG
jgi:hypothetical protein